VIRTAIRTAHPTDTPDGSKDIYIGPDGKAYVRTSTGVLRRLDHDGRGMEMYQHRHSGGSYANTWIVPNRTTGGSNTTYVTPDQALVAVPWPVAVSMTVSEIAVYVTAAGVGAPGLLHLGIYYGIDEDDDGPLRGLDIYPGALLADCGSVDITTTGEKKITGLAVPLEEGRLYFGAALCDVNGGTPVTLRAMPLTAALALVGTDSAWGNPPTHIQAGAALTALPDPFSASPTLVTAACPIIAIRRSA